MIIAKLSPAIEIVKQDNILSQPVTTSVEYIGAAAVRYAPGVKSAIFEVSAGNYIPEVAGENGLPNQPAKFQRIQTSNLTLTSEELSSWGTDDNVLYDIIAGKLNKTIVELVEVTFG